MKLWNWDGKKGRVWEDGAEVGMGDWRDGFRTFQGGGGGRLEVGDELGKGETEGEAVVGATSGLTSAGEVVGEEKGAEFVFGERGLALGTGVEGISLIEFTGRDGVVGILGATGFEEEGKEVLVTQAGSTSSLLDHC